MEIRNGLIQFRHPLVEGKVIRAGAIKFSKEDQRKIEDGINWLLEHKPVTRDAIPEGVECH